MMRKIFEAPAMSINRFSVTDVVTTSGGEVTKPNVNDALAGKLGSTTVNASQSASWDSMLNYSE